MDMVRQSMPFSYFTMSAESNDGNNHTLRMYSDISGGTLLVTSSALRCSSKGFCAEFIAGNTNAIAEWNSTDDGQYIVLSVTLQSPSSFSEITNVPEDATEYYSFKRVSSIDIPIHCLTCSLPSLSCHFPAFPQQISGTSTTWQITQDTINRVRAENMTVTLANEQDPLPRAVGL